MNTHTAYIKLTADDTIQEGDCYFLSNSGRVKSGFGEKYGISAETNIYFRPVEVPSQPAPNSVRAVHNPCNVPEDKVLDGWRFLFVDELETAAVKRKCRIWNTYHKWWLDELVDGLATDVTYIIRKEPEQKPAPVWAPLGPDDVPPGSVVRLSGDIVDKALWVALGCLDTDGVFLADGNDSFISWDTLYSEWEILRPGGQWEPCRKEVQP